MAASRAVDWREQIEATIAGQVPAVMPAIFRMSRWYKARQQLNDWPVEVAGWPLPAIEDYLGLARSARYAKVYHVRFRSPAEQIVRRNGPELITEYRINGKSLVRRQRFNGDDEAFGLDAAIAEYPIRTPEDYATLTELAGCLEFVPAYDEYRAYDAQIGSAGLPMAVIGANPFHYLLQEWTGYERGYLDLYDRPDVLLEAVAALERSYRRMWDVVAESPARLVMHGVNFDTPTTPPPIFREHFLPYLREFNARMHAAGKLMAFHADGDMSRLLNEPLECGFDVADCFACRPLVPCAVQAARAAWRDRITIWGALPSTLLEPPTPLDELRRSLDTLAADIGPPSRFLLGITDMAMPSTSWPHLLAVRDWLANIRG